MDYLNSPYPVAVMDSLRDLYAKVIWYLPNLIVALIVLIVGWLIGSLLGGLVRKVLELVKIDMLANQLGMDKLSARAGRNLSIARLGDWLVKWFFFLASFIAAADILGLSQVTDFFYNSVLPYAGHVIVAAAIMFLGLLAASFFSGIVETAAHAGGHGYARALASVAKWAIIGFTVIAVLSELQIASDFLHDLFKAIVYMLTIAGGIAFGWGGKDHAKKVLDDVERGLRRHE